MASKLARALLSDIISWMITKKHQGLVRGSLQFLHSIALELFQTSNGLADLAAQFISN